MRAEVVELSFEETVERLNGEIQYRLMEKYDEEERPELSIPEKYYAIAKELFLLDFDPDFEEPRLFDRRGQSTVLHRILNPFLDQLATLPAFQAPEDRSPAYQWTLEALTEVYATEKAWFQKEYPEAEPVYAFLHAQHSLLHHRADPRVEDGELFDDDAAFDFYLDEYLKYWQVVRAIRRFEEA